MAEEEDVSTRFLETGDIDKTALESQHSNKKSTTKGIYHQVTNEIYDFDDLQFLHFVI